uniref:Uncharacterized protein n=1 Tax=Cyclopterus lumpus TaxID=8103 RepID=A0A8C2Z743_CYCLU
MLALPFVWWEAQRERKLQVSNTNTSHTQYVSNMDHLTAPAGATVMSPQRNRTRHSSEKEAAEVSRTPQVAVQCAVGDLCVAAFDVCRTGGCPKGSLRSEDREIWMTSHNHKYLCTGKCTWADVFASTNPKAYVNRSHENFRKISLTGPISQCDGKTVWDGPCNMVSLAVTNPQENMTGYYSLGVGRVGGPLYLVHIQVSRLLLKEQPGVTEAPPNALVSYVNISSVRETIATETGFDKPNIWLNWLVYTAKDLQRPDCLVCANSNCQDLLCLPFALNPGSDKEGFKCMLELFKSRNNPKCITLALLFPAVPSVYPPEFTYYKGNYTCLHSSHGSSQIGTLNHCQTIINVTAGEGDIQSYCGDRVLRDYLPGSWRGTCALVRLIMPVTMVPLSPESLRRLNLEANHSPSLTRTRRDVLAASFDKSIYIDCIGVPRGVPDEYKARSPILAGFESIFIWPTVNKNVDWINYIYYNQQRFVNYTRDAIKGIQEQLESTSLMAWQNRMALDMLLAESGGVCKMFGKMCCTFIPNNTAPDCSVTRALAGLTSLSKELAENSGVEEVALDFLSQWLGKYASTFFVTISTVVTLGVLLVLFVRCCLPLLKACFSRFITTVVSEGDQHTRIMPLVFLERGVSEQDPEWEMRYSDPPPSYFDVIWEYEAI